MIDLKEQTIDVITRTKASFLLREKEQKDHLYILLHGYMSNAQRMWNRFSERFPRDTNLLAINGPYPIPIKKDEGYIMSYSWYFFDPIEKKYFISYDVCTDYTYNVTAQLGYEQSSKTLIGFSQGGYASVHIAKKLLNVQRIIGIGCAFVTDQPTWRGNMQVHALHGEEDDIVSLQHSKEHFDKLPSSNRGVYETFPGVKHKPSDEMLDRAVQLAL